MGWGGSALAAMQTIKNNRAMLGKRKKGKLSYASAINEKWVDPKTASPELLEEIRLKLKRDRKHSIIKLSVMTLFLLSILIGTVYATSVFFFN